MKKFIFITIALSAVSTFSFVKGQSGDLQYNAALIVSAEDTVPAGKVWKITSIYGSDRICTPNLVPDYTSAYPYPGYWVAFVGSSFYVNGRAVYSERKWDVTSGNEVNIYNNITCTSYYSNRPRGWAAYDIAPNYNILPMWLPAGTIVKTATLNVMLSVLEFNIL